MFRFLQSVEPWEMTQKCGLTAPHTSHCLGSGDIMISCMGDPEGEGKGITMKYQRHRQ